ncbi:MAG: hypothetical protein OHK0017_12980 [Patescibacteria group bacterium]
MSFFAQLYWVFIFGGFAVAFRYWYEWLNTRWLENIIGEWFGQQEFTTVFIQPPSQNIKSLAAMEAFFRNMHAIHTTKSNKNAYYEGSWYKHFTLEIHSIGGRVGIFAYMFKSDLGLFKQALTAHYPECTVIECPDPMEYLPSEWDKAKGAGPYKYMVGADFVLAQSDMFPTKTWRDLMPDGMTALYDPINALFSTFESLKPNEHCVLQYVIRPNTKSFGDWGKKREKEAEELKKKLATNSDVEATKFGTMALTREEQALIQGVQQKLSQFGVFETKIRFMALSEDNPGVNAYLGFAANFFKQMDGLKNSIIPDDKTKTTKVSNWFPIFDDLYWKNEKKHRQEREYAAVRGRSWSRSNIHNVQTADILAALVHMPITSVTDVGVTMRIQSNFGLTPNSAPAGAPPINLPT